ncbi:uncharacterized protein K02A2.6-like, partial [Protobothrops mucrosquamatus]|uniref:uncharacterized protein K02A2.6-like n=1 Tax=Protobothrops mucrosquamatus TaxID=103944 RepID=UPI0010FAE926
MNLSPEQFQKLLMQQQLQMETQWKLIDSLTQRLNLQSPDPGPREFQTNSIDMLANTITEFNYDANVGHTFDAWFKRWEDMFRTDFSRQDDSWKVRVLVRKLGTNEHSRFVDHILPKQPRDLKFDEVVAQLSEIFGETASLFSIRYECLKIVKHDTDDYGMLADTVNRECERFKLRLLTDDQFKCLIFIRALQSPQDADIRTRLLSKLDHDPDMNLKSLMAECKRLISLKHDAAMVEQKIYEAEIKPVHAMKKGRPVSVSKSMDNRSRQPPTACWSCGQWHFVRFCPFKKHLCQKCNRRGHKEECCTLNRPSNVSRKKSVRTGFKKTYPESRSVVAAFQADLQGRRKYITLLINGKSTRLQFDTASDITLISKSTWNHIGRPLVISSIKEARN